MLITLFPSLALTCDIRSARVPGSGLRKVLKEGESVPEIFEDPVVKRASRWVLSTSALVATHLREYGWGEVRLAFPFFCDGRRATLTNFHTGRARWLWRCVYHLLRWYVKFLVDVYEENDLSLTLSTG